MNKNHAIFYLELEKNERKEKKLYVIAKKCVISRQNAVGLLSYFKQYGLLDYWYDTEYFSHVIKFSRDGRELLRLMQVLTKLMIKTGIWGGDDAFKNYVGQV